MATDTFAITADGDDIDGRMQSLSDWAGMGPGGTYADDAYSDTLVTVQKHGTSGVFMVTNGFLRFDTSALPDGATITGANLLLYLDGKGDPDGVTYAADFYAGWDGAPSFAADWEQSSSGDCISSISPGSLTAGIVNTIPLTGLAGISKTGYTGIRLAPADTTEPTGDNYLDFAGYGNAAQEPRLEVTYTTGGTDATVTAVAAGSTAGSVAPPRPRPEWPFLEVNVRM